MSNQSPFQAMRHHNEVYKDLHGNKQEAQEQDQARHDRMLLNVELLRKSVNAKAPQDVLRHYASLIRFDAEALGIMIHITA